MAFIIRQIRQFLIVLCLIVFEVHKDAGKMICFVWNYKRYVYYSAFLAPEHGANRQTLNNIDRTVAFSISVFMLFYRKAAAIFECFLHLRSYNSYVCLNFREWPKCVDKNVKGICQMCTFIFGIVRKS